MARSMTEDAVRDLAREALGLVDSEIARAGVGQLTTFNQLGFPGVADKPDGWYLPNNKNEVAVVLETKATRITLGQAQVDEVLKNVRIMQTQYKKVVGILYNGEDIRVFKGEEEVKTPTKLQSVSYYLSLYTVDSIDKERIYELTAKINNGLHFEFGIKNLYHRMIFTACALVAERYGAGLRRLKDMGYATFHTAIHSTLSKSLEDSRKQNAKIDILLEEYSDIKMNTTDDQQAINDFIDWVVEISECVNSNEWRGEDVMGIFFNEFNRYKKKSEAGQVFTPEHITDFMYKIISVLSVSDVQATWLPLSISQSRILPSVEIVTTCHGMNFPLCCKAVFAACSSPPQQGTSMRTTVTLFISLLRMISVSFSE